MRLRNNKGRQGCTSKKVLESMAAQLCIERERISENSEKKKNESQLMKEDGKIVTLPPSYRPRIPDLV
jgi:hypothetical protein